MSTIAVEVRVTDELVKDADPADLKRMLGEDAYDAIVRCLAEANGQ